MNNGAYNFREIEKKWRNRWLSQKTFKTPNPGDEGFSPDQPKCYVLDMFPYPSGSGLHIGHPKGYIASDIYTRYKLMQGYNVLHPMGFDSFGLPAEQYAIEHNVHPSIITEENIDAIRSQLQFLGLAYDWDREIATSREDYYRWTQWIFLQLFNSWFDVHCMWKDAAGREIQGRARPLEDLVDGFETGVICLSDADLQMIGNAAKSWGDLDNHQKEALLNNYRLAYQKEVIVNWCPGLGTVLANEEVTNEGKSERGDFPVYKRPLRQWIMRITAYSDRLLKDLDEAELPDGRGTTFSLEWPEPVKLMQRNWIGRSGGAEVNFEILKPGSQDVVDIIPVFTTRPDTLFGATFMVLAPEHPLIDAQSEKYLVPERWPSAIDPRWMGVSGSGEVHSTIAAYIQESSEKSSVDAEEMEKTGVFTGILARNPVNGQSLPVFVADYVSMEYGSGAIMAVPAHDERDFEFAQKYGLDIIEVVQAPQGLEEPCFTGEGLAINSPVDGEGDFAITGLATAEAKEKIIGALQEKGLGRGALNYKLRDWVFSRQRYWGEPFPLVVQQDEIVVDTPPPILLPEMEDFRPQTSDDPNMPVSPPLSRAPEEWRLVQLNGAEGQRELNVMPQWAGSCWYFLRFIDPHNGEEFCAAQAQDFFMPVDLYIGGAEHAVLHLLYARFWHKVLFDLGHVGTPEPFKKLFNQGMITADAFADDRGVYIDIREVEIRDGEPFNSNTGEKLQRFSGKMGKRFKNGLPPEEVGEEFGVDTLRLYEMYMGPLEASAPWSMEGIRGMQRFLQRVWRNFISPERTVKIGGVLSADMERLLHRTMLKVTDDLEALRFNTAIAALIELNNEMVKFEDIPRDLGENFLLMLTPFAPHLTAEIWEVAGWEEADISRSAWPEGDVKLTEEETVTLPVQVNGKVRGNVVVSVDIQEDELKQIVLELENVKRHIKNGSDIKRFIVIPKKIVNVVV